jgi:hypothetical protein
MNATDNTPTESAAAPAAERPVIGATSAPTSLSDHAKQWGNGVVSGFTPPELWTNGRPSLKASWVWARHGEHLPDDDAARLGSRIAAGITIPLRAVLLYLDWLLERPSRFVAALVLVLVIVQILHPIF